ncbi:endonuclease/exonuclease/phosphatase family protein [Marinicella sp. W31]|uniref:endonuclease/exonuclease/phosphatase family protein n=1 Tax=Marinicella sp. W31 TaxID=3023713 RepID=UPI0037574AE6
MQISVTTYNIHRAIGIDRRFAPDRIIDILSGFNSDVILLQEVDEGVPRSRELNLAREIAESMGYPYYALGHNVSLKKGYYGNATLSRFPILRERNINLTIDGKKRRGCQHTCIQIHDDPKSEKFEVFNLHLGLSAKERQKQAGILFHSKQFRDLDHKVPCLVGGDFNDWRSMLRALFIEGMDFKCATDKSTKRGVTAIKTYPSFAPRGGLDRMYYRGHMQLLGVTRSRRKLAKIASDHLPINTVFKIRS